MSNVGLLFLCVVVSLIVGMLIFVIEKVSELESLTEKLVDNKTASSESAQAKIESDEDFDHLQGKPLWGALVNGPQDSSDSADRRKKYEYLFEKHVKHVIDKGYEDGLVQGAKKHPPNEVVFSMLRGDVTSWLPTSESNALYDLAYAASNVMRSDASSLADNVSNLIFGLSNQVALDGTVLNQEVLVRLRLLSDANL